MNVFLIAATSLDGFIAPSRDQISTNWTSKEDRTFFSKKTKEAGVVVMGSSTYKTIGRPLPGRSNVVYSRKNIQSVIDDTGDSIRFVRFEEMDPGFRRDDDTGGDLKNAQSNTVFLTQLAPRQLLNGLEKAGYSEVAICGGASIYSQFMQAGVVDSLFITVEPIIFGAGVKLFSDQVKASLSLVKVAQFESGGVVLEYKVRGQSLGLRA